MALPLPEFVHRWKTYEGTERSGAQPHFLDLCALLGQPTPAQHDSIGERYAFEKHVTKTDTGSRLTTVCVRASTSFPVDLAVVDWVYERRGGVEIEVGVGRRRRSREDAERLVLGALQEREYYVR